MYCRFFIPFSGTEGHTVKTRIGWQSHNSPSSPASSEYSHSHILAAALSHSTRRTYSAAIKSVYSFIRRAHPKALLFPAASKYIIAYITFASNRGLSPSTITSQLSVVSYLHKLASLPDPNQRFLIQKMLAGARKLKPQSDVRLPITPNILRLLIQAVDATAEAPYYNVMLKAMFLLAFHALLRVGEFTTTSTSGQQHTLQHKDVQLVSREETFSLLVTMHSFKHSRQPTSLDIAPQRGPLCPVTAYQNYMLVRGKQQGPLFMFPNHAPVTRNFFINQLNSALRWAKLDPRYYKGHGFRLGAATTAAANGMSEPQIEAMGRWHSKAYKKYIRIPTLSLI